VEDTSTVWYHTENPGYISKTYNLNTDIETLGSLRMKEVI